MRPPSVLTALQRLCSTIDCCTAAKRLSEMSYFSRLQKPFPRTSNNCGLRERAKCSRRIPYFESGGSLLRQLELVTAIAQQANSKMMVELEKQQHVLYSRSGGNCSIDNALRMLPTSSQHLDLRLISCHSVNNACSLGGFIHPQAMPLSQTLHISRLLGSGSSQQSKSIGPVGAKSKSPEQDSPKVPELTPLDFLKLALQIALIAAAVICTWLAIIPVRLLVDGFNNLEMVLANLKQRIQELLMQHELILIYLARERTDETLLCIFLCCKTLRKANRRWWVAKLRIDVAGILTKWLLLLKGKNGGELDAIFKKYSEKLEKLRAIMRESQGQMERILKAMPPKENLEVILEIFQLLLQIVKKQRMTEYFLYVEMWKELLDIKEGDRAAQRAGDEEAVEGTKERPGEDQQQPESIAPTTMADPNPSLQPA